MPIRLPVVLSPSRAELAARCHRRHVLHEVCDRRSFNSPSAAFGTVVHKGCAVWWLTGSKYEALSELRDEWNERRPSGDKHTMEMGEDLLECYISNAELVPRALEEDINWELLEDEEGRFIERRVEIELEGKILSFQLDRALVSVTKNIIIADIKTTSRLNSKVEAGWARSLQQKLYVVGVRKKFPWVKKVFSFIEALEKKASPVFKLVELPQWTEKQLDEALESWLASAEEDELVIGKGVEVAIARHGEKYTDEQLREAVEEIAVTQTTFNYMDCYSYFLQCPYLPLCDSSPELRIGQLWSDFEIHETEGY